MLTRKLIELLAPAVSGLCWHGGPDSSVMSHLHCFHRSNQQARSVLAPLPQTERSGHITFLTLYGIDVKVFSRVSFMKISANGALMFWREAFLTIQINHSRLTTFRQSLLGVQCGVA